MWSHFVTAISSPRSQRRRFGRSGWLVPVLVTVLAVTGCSSGDGGDGGDSKDGAQSSGGKKSDEPPATKFTLTPAVGAADVAPASTVVLAVDRGKLTTVAVKSATGDVVQGTVAADGKTWTSKGKLGFGAKYTVEAVTDEKPAPQSVGSFSTVATPGASKSVRATSVIGDGKTYGVGMPVILKLNNAVRTPEQRAAFEKSIKVRSTPVTSGAWGWVNSREVHFRPKIYWAAGSTVHVEVDSAGRALGGGLWSRTDLTLDFKIGVKREIKANATSHQMQVIESGKLVRTVPVSLGSAKHPSSSGTMVIIDKRPEAMFDSSTYGLAVNAPGGYRTKVKVPMRLTWGGEFLHQAEWSVADQGKRNVSHGCINIAPANANWLYARAQVGDPVTVVNSEAKVKPGDGWTAWSVSFASWLSQSAAGEVSTGATPAAAAPTASATPGA
jgi:lipoprotein-anchoring transpeptidase ErfK/SrfK